MNRENLPEILTLDQVAAFLNVHASTIYRLVWRHQIPAFRIGSDWRFERARIEEWIGRMHERQEQVANKKGRHKRSGKLNGSATSDSSNGGT